jgi:DNA-binding IclR family transcriptional regulator
MNSIDKLFTLLEQFSLEQPQWGVRSLAKQTGLKVSLVHWYLKNLERKRVVRKNPETQKYELGMGLFELSGKVRKLTIVVRIANPILYRLTEMTKGTSVLRIVDGNELLSLASVESPVSVRVHHAVGTRLPINFGSVGKVIMAHLPEDRIADLIASGQVKKFTEKTIVDPATLRKQLALIKLRGWACTTGEAIEGARAISAPIRDITGEVFGGIGITFPVIALPNSQVKRMAKLVVSSANMISEQLGWTIKSKTSAAYG